MKVGDLVRTPKPCFPEIPEKWFWWHDRIGIVLKAALSTVECGEPVRCWHILIGANTTNLEERKLEVINEGR